MLASRTFWELQLLCAAAAAGYAGVQRVHAAQVGLRICRGVHRVVARVLLASETCPEAGRLLAALQQNPSARLHLHLIQPKQDQAYKGTHAPAGGAQRSDGSYGQPGQHALGCVPGPATEGQQGEPEGPDLQRRSTQVLLGSNS